MDIDSEAQKDLVLNDNEADGVTGGIETTKNSANRRARKRSSRAAAGLVGAPIVIHESIGTGIDLADAAGQDGPPEFAGRDGSS